MRTTCRATSYKAKTRDSQLFGADKNAVNGSHVGTVRVDGFLSQTMGCKTVGSVSGLGLLGGALQALTMLAGLLTAGLDDVGHRGNE
jgi:hypothetical protein